KTLVTSERPRGSSERPWAAASVTFAAGSHSACNRGLSQGNSAQGRVAERVFMRVRGVAITRCEQPYPVSDRTAKKRLVSVSPHRFARQGSTVPRLRGYTRTTSPPLRTATTHSVVARNITGYRRSPRCPLPRHG